MRCYLNIKESYERLSVSEKRIAKYIIDNPSEVVKMPIGDLADKCQTSKPTVVRLCKSLGYSGYKELCMYLNADIMLSENGEMTYKDINPNDESPEIVAKVAENNIKAIKNTMEIMDYAELNRAVDLLMNARRIDFYGVGNSGFVAMDAQNKFLRINKLATAQTDPHLQILTASNLSENDVAVFISYTGETRDLLETMEIVKSTGAATISITKLGKNSLSLASDVNLFMVSDESFIRSGAMSSRIGQLCIVDILFSIVTSRMYSDIKPYLDRSMAASKKKKTLKV
ncbi:MAG: MurR/RpiR family transcriptional regulator [Clostridia bacterium]|nr:MurR/RpiR family transcriptional regulator [Clostridia bacterium]